MDADRVLVVCSLVVLVVAPVATAGAAGTTVGDHGASGGGGVDADRVGDRGSGSQADEAGSVTGADGRRSDARTDVLGRDALRRNGSAGLPSVTGNLVVRRVNGTVVEYELSVLVDEADVPDALAVGVQPRESVAVVESSGLSEGVPGEFTWDGKDGAPRLVLRVDYREFSTANGAGLAHEDWMLALAPRIWVEWTDDGQRYGVGGWTMRSIDGWSASARDGVVAPGLWTYFGEYDVVERTTDGGERIRLVVPESVDDDEVDHLDTLVRVGEDFDGGGVDEDAPVLGVVMPDVAYNPGSRGVLVRDVRVDGVARGDAFVVEENRNDTLWVEEYLHTRQEFRPASARTRWLLDASVGYYKRLYQYRLGDVSRDRLVADLTDPGFYSEDALARPSTWENERTRYEKGPKVVAYLDWRIRALTDGEASFEDVHRRLNDHERPIRLSTFKNVVARVVGNDTLDEEIGRYVTTGAFPDREAFVLPPELREGGDRSELETGGTTTDGTTAGPASDGETTEAATGGDAGTTTATDGGGSGSLPGFGAGAVLLALAVLVAGLARRRGRP